MDKGILLFLLGALVAVNLLTFCLYGADKGLAKGNCRRISERTLLLFAFFFGSLGAWLGMQIFRHKTRHKKFTVLVPLFLLLHIGLALGLLWLNFGKNFF